MKVLCIPISTKTQEIGIDYIFTGQKDQNGDSSHAKGLNGILYRLVECSIIQRILTLTRQVLTVKKSDEDLTEPHFLLCTSL
jgi:hypothetical protein